MYWVEVDGFTLPWKIGGHPTLDFCNTRADWGVPPGPRAEWLRGYPALATWSGYAGLLDHEAVAALRALAGDRPTEAETALAEARDLRASVYATLLDPADTAAFETVARYAEEAAAVARLEMTADAVAAWRIPVSIGLRLPVLATARSAADLLTDPRRAKVRACPGRGCGWLFLDLRGRRRWCSMATCGNRAKVRAHSQRHR